jgi:nitroimidazol reductase NimA-like FMN-containing flavoprotein (pyridoxamine 5'-phosphate oxidase superfamily)
MRRRSEVDPRVRVRRAPERAAYDADTVHAVLDAGFLCHVGVVRDGRPVVIPTLYARDGDRLLLHGSPATGMFRAAGKHPDVCVTVTHLDGMVLARSVFHHSMNYRSVVVHGAASRVEGDAEINDALRVLVEHIAPGQWSYARQPNADELRQTEVWAVPLDAASAKLRVGGPKDEPEDYELPVWAGVLPLRLAAGGLLPDEQLGDGITPAPHLRRLGDRTR